VIELLSFLDASNAIYTTTVYSCLSLFLNFSLFRALHVSCRNATNHICVRLLFLTNGLAPESVKHESRPPSWHGDATAGPLSRFFDLLNSTTRRLLQSSFFTFALYIVAL
jgi:hypothetical protein